MDVFFAFLFWLFGFNADHAAKNPIRDQGPVEIENVRSPDSDPLKYKLRGQTIIVLDDTHFRSDGND